MPIFACTLIESLFCVIVLAFNLASWPLTAVNIESVAGSKMAPTTGEP